MGRGAARAAPLPDLGLQMPLGAGLRVLLEREASIAVVRAVRLLGRAGRLRAPAAPSQATRKGGSNAHPEGHRAHARMCASGRDRSRQNQCHFTPVWVRARNEAPASEISRCRHRRTALRRAGKRLHVAQPAVSSRRANSSSSSGSSSSTATSAALSSPSRASPCSRRRGTCCGTPKSRSRPRATLATW